MAKDSVKPKINIKPGVRQVRLNPSRRRADKIRQIVKLATRIEDVSDLQTLNAFRNEIIKILMTL